MPTFPLAINDDKNVPPPSKSLANQKKTFIQSFPAMLHVDEYVGPSRHSPLCCNVCEIRATLGRYLHHHIQKPGSNRTQSALRECNSNLSPTVHRRGCMQQSNQPSESPQDVSNFDEMPPLGWDRRNLRWNQCKNLHNFIAGHGKRDVLRIRN